MPQKKPKCQYCKRTYHPRSIITVQNWEGCRDCLARLSKGLEPLKYGRKNPRAKSASKLRGKDNE